jgi:hypothetical protein
MLRYTPIRVLTQRLKGTKGRRFFNTEGTVGTEQCNLTQRLLKGERRPQRNTALLASRAGCCLEEGLRA